MDKLLNSGLKLGVVGGGQLGKMLAIDASRWQLEISCLESSNNPPIQSVCRDIKPGSITSYEDVLEFGQGLDYLTVESDSVNAKALIKLESKGVKTFPRGQTLEIIQDKYLQRKFCSENNLPTPEFSHYSNKESLVASHKQGSLTLPKIIKTCRAGYDGKGVFLAKSENDLEDLPDTDLLVEELVDIKKEFSVIVVRSSVGETTCYPAIELFMRENAYLVDYFISPVDLKKKLGEQMEEIAKKLVISLDHVGVLAIEFFLDSSDQIFINECSPRPHNSGHHTIEGSVTSQYEQHLRAVLGLPLGKCEMTGIAGVVNLLGDQNYSGKPNYRGLEECLKLAGTYVHIYGKNETRPLRKMGHITTVGQELPEVLEKIEIIRKEAGVGK